MHPGKQIALAFLLLPVAELAAFILVAGAIGFLPAVGLMAATSLAGLLILRAVGRGRLASFRLAVVDRGVAEWQANGAGFVLVLVGILLLLPGFITDLMGGLLLLPPTRRWLAIWLAATIRRANRGAGSHQAGRAVVDLEREEWRQVPAAELPKTSQPPRDQ